MSVSDVTDLQHSSHPPSQLHLELYSRCCLVEMAPKPGRNQAERTGQLWGRDSCCVLFITMDPNRVSSKPDPTNALLSRRKCHCARGRLSHPHVLCHLHHCSSPLPSRCWPPTVSFDSETRFGTSPLLTGEMAIKAHTCFLFHSAVGLEQWKAIYAGKEFYKENDATNVVPTKMGMGKGREFTAQRSVK